MNYQYDAFLSYKRDRESVGATRMNLGRRRTIPGKSLVHASAFERGDEYRKRLPADAIRVDRRPPPTV